MTKRKTKYQISCEAHEAKLAAKAAREAACAHPVATLTAGTDTIMNCPAEGWPDESVSAVHCTACGAVMASGAEAVTQLLLDHVKRLSAEVEGMKRERKA